MQPLELSPRWETFVRAITYPVIILFVLPYTFLYHAIRYFASNVGSIPHCSFPHYTRINLIRIDRYARVLPPGANKRLVNCDYVSFSIPPLSPSVPRLGPLLATASKVASCDSTCFMMSRKEPHSSAMRLQAPALKGEKVIFFIVGGGYAAGHPLNIHSAWSLAEITGARVFTVNYRKSLDDHSAFPASLLDCLAGYQYLVDELGFEPQNILTNGDSAGANACMAMSRYLGDLEDSSYGRWRQVGAMVLHHPWSDMSGSFPSVRTNRYTDILMPLDKVNVRSHTRHFRDQTKSLYFSPALAGPGDWLHLTRHEVKVYISVGTAEAFRDEIMALYKSMRSEGVDVDLRSIEGASHSDFVFHDDDRLPSHGWSWPMIKADFIAFWDRFENGSHTSDSTASCYKETLEKGPVLDT